MRSKGMTVVTPFTARGFQFRFDPDGEGHWLVTIGTKVGSIAARFERTSDGYRWLTDIWSAEAAVAAVRA